MVSTKKLACPFCDVRLRVAETLPVGKRITCPKCGEGFPVPDPLTLPSPPAAGGEGRVRGGNDATPAPKAATVSSTYALPPVVGERKVKRTRKAPPPHEDEGQAEERAARPKARKRRKKMEEAASNTSLVLGLVIGGAVSLIVAAVVLVILRPWEKKAEEVAVSTPARSAVAQPGSPDPGRAAQRPGRGGRGPTAEPQPPAAEPTSSGPAATGAGSDLLAIGERVYEANNCKRCHPMGGGGMRGRGPDLSRIGTKRTVDWLVEQIRDPQSHRPGSRMPSYGDKISEDDLRALATYLASLK